MKLFTIGFKRKSAKEFFGVLQKAGVKKLIDVRRKNGSQLSGFTKGRDLQFFLDECFGIAYEHIPEFAPSEQLLKEYQRRLGRKNRDEAAWADYVEHFQREVANRPIVERFQQATGGVDNVSLLCSEETGECCHSRLIAEHLQQHLTDIDIVHL